MPFTMLVNDCEVTDTGAGSLWAPEQGACCSLVFRQLLNLFAKGHPGRRRHPQVWGALPEATVRPDASMKAEETEKEGRLFPVQLQASPIFSL